MRMRGYTLKEMSQILTQHGWRPSHRKSSHITFQNENTDNHITLVDHGKSKEICRPLAKKILKQAGLLEFAYGYEC